MRQHNGREDRPHEPTDKWAAYEDWLLSSYSWSSRERADAALLRPASAGAGGGANWPRFLVGCRSCGLAFPQSRGKRLLGGIHRFEWTGRPHQPYPTWAARRVHLLSQPRLARQDGR